MVQAYFVGLVIRHLSVLNVVNKYLIIKYLIIQITNKYRINVRGLLVGNVLV